MRRTVDGVRRFLQRKDLVAYSANHRAIGCVRKEWRESIGKFKFFPLFQDTAIETALYFSDSKDITFGFADVFLDIYDIGPLIGSGTFGNVHMASIKSANRGRKRHKLDLAVKIIAKRTILNTQNYLALRQEAEIMSILGGTLNVAHFYGAFEDDENVYFLLERCKGGDVYDRVHDVVQKDESITAKYMHDIFRVVSQCHDLNIIHRDLKLENFLFADVTADAPIKLSDFGAATMPSPPEKLRKTITGTPLYTAPEVLDKAYSYPADLWSCGIILYKLLSGKFPYVSGPLLDEQIRYSDIDFEGEPWAHVSDSAKDLVMRLLNRNTKERLTARQALCHTWLQQYNIATEKSMITFVAPELDGTLVQRLQFYRELNGLQHVAFLSIAKLLPESDISKRGLIDLFSRIQASMTHHDPSKFEAGRNFIDISFFAAALNQNGYSLTYSEVRMLLSRMDVDGDGKIGRDEFCSSLLNWFDLQLRSEWRSLVSEAFRIFDSDHDGLITLEDVESQMPVGNTVYRYTMHTDVQYCFELADTDENGFIDEAEFNSMLTVPHDAWKYFASRLT